jgi:hypothetical protein
MQGCAQGLYDVNGIQIVLRLWNGISNSPISGMQSGYGIGALITVQTLKPFIKYNPSRNIENEAEIPFNSTLNQNLKLRPYDITLQVPYGISAAFGCLMTILFLFAQYFEMRNTRCRLKRQQNISNLFLKNRNKTKRLVRDDDDENVDLQIAQRLFFNDKAFKRSQLIYKVIQVILLVLLCIGANGYQTVISSFLFTYLTKGPAKFHLADMMAIQSMYWGFFVIGRLVNAVVAFRMNSILVFGCLVLFNVILLSILIVPTINTIQLSYWFMICAMGTSVSPIIPTCFMLAKTILKQINSLTASLFCVGLGIGGLSSVYLTGLLLDSFAPAQAWLGYIDATSSYILPMILFSWLSFIFLIFISILFVYKRFKHLSTN